jgi:hypothetical protein
MEVVLGLCSQDRCTFLRGNQNGPTPLRSSSSDRNVCRDLELGKELCPWDEMKVGSARRTIFSPNDDVPHLWQIVAEKLSLETKHARLTC